MQFITVKEAIDLTGKVDRTIRTFCNENPEACKKEENRLLVDKEALLEKYPEIEKEDLRDKDHEIELLKEKVRRLEGENSHLNRALSLAERNGNIMELLLHLVADGSLNESNAKQIISLTDSGTKE